MSTLMNHVIVQGKMAELLQLNRVEMVIFDWPTYQTFDINHTSG
jgi:hypothetical protein